jgi:PAS domain S-box-containing protein
MHTNNDPHFRNLVDNALTGIIDNTLEGKILFVNQALARMLEFESPQQMQAEGTLLRWCDLEHRKVFISRLKQQGYVNNYEAEVFSKTGKHLHVLLSARLHGDVISSMVVDITECKKTEIALQESNQRFRATFEQAAVGITHMAPGGRFLRVNQKFCDITGYSQDELLQRTCQEITYPDDLEPDFSCIRRLLTGGTSSYTLEKRYIRKGGELVWAEVTFSLVVDETGEPLWFVSVAQDISRRKQAEAALQNSEKRFRDIADNALEWIWEVDGNGKYTYVSPIAEKLLGYKPEELLQNHFYDLFHPDDKEELKRAAFEAFAGKERFNEFINRAVHKNGKVVWLSTSGIPIIDESGELAGYRGADIDITKRKLAEDALLESEEKFRTLVTKTEEIVYMIARDGTFLLSEGRGLAKLAMKPGQVVGKSVFELYKDYPDMLDGMRRVFNGETVSNEVNVDGNYFRSWYTPHKNHEGEIIGLLGLSVNITEQKNAEKALAQSEVLFRTIYENSPVMIDAFDDNGRCTMWNKECEKVFGWTAEEIFSHENPLALFYPDPEVRKQVAELVALKPEKIFREWAPLGKDGSERNCLWANFRLPNGMTIGIGHDITARKMSEHKIHAYQKRLRALASELTLTEERQRRNIALDLHDHVGQSLAVMRMQLAVARKESGGRKVATILDEVSDSLRTAIQDTRNVISDLSSPVINELGLAAALSEWLKERIGEHYGLETQFIDNGEPKPLGADTEAILFRSIRELLTNVVKHANANRVSVSLQRRGGTVQIVVEDDGTGLLDGSHPGKDNTDGGFGLFSIEERMSDLGGSFEIESHPGRGVRAILTAPLEPGTPQG